MQIKRNTEILEISHDELVDLFSTAFYGSTYLSAEYDREFYDSIPADKKEGDCYEDKMADILLNGGTIFVYDNNSDGEIYNNRSNAEVIDDDGCTQYTISLVDIIDGLQKAANGTYKVNNDSKWIAQCFNDFENIDEGDLDLIEADALMQIILFNEVIYG